MKIKNALLVIVLGFIIVYSLFFTGLSESELYGVYTNDYKNHRDTVWLCPNGVGYQKIYDKNNRMVYSHKLTWTYDYILPRSSSTISISSMTFQYDVDYTDSLHSPAEEFLCEPAGWGGMSIGCYNDTIMFFTKCYTEAELLYRNFKFYKVSDLR